MRVVVLNFNGGEMTFAALRSLLECRGPEARLELVLVDNASTDGVAERVAAELPEVRVIRSPENRGFAGGNNLALTDLDLVDLVALVNNDAFVTAGWLAPLIEAVRDAGVGAASPKILFDGRFRQLDLATTPSTTSAGDRRPRGVRIVDVRTDPDIPGRARLADGFYEPCRDGSTTGQWSALAATIYVPTPPHASEPTSCVLVIDSDEVKELVVRSGLRTDTIRVSRGRAEYEVELDGPTFDLINNVGCELVADDYVADRGWLQPDRGQFDQREEVWAWSGGAVLFRADYLEDVGLFDERLFLYYEDVELSWRGRERGWRYEYVPSSVVRHAHATTTQQDSPLARYYNERNRLLVLTRHAPLSRVGRAIVRYLLVTASYVRRDVVAPALRMQRPDTTIVVARSRAFAGYLRRALGQYRDRTIRRRSGV